MSASCLQVDISIASPTLKAQASLLCGLASPYFPLLVDEGYLFVEEDGVTYFLSVDRK
jgi:hypothetical protein